MKAFERREAGITASYKLAAWNERNQSWKELRGTYDSQAGAIIAASKPGRYRVSRVDSGSWSDATTFEV